MSTAIRLRIVAFSIEPNAAETSRGGRASASSSPVSGAYCARTASLIASIASWRASFSGTLVASSIAVPCESRISREQALVDRRGLDRDLLLAGLRGQLLHRADELLDLGVGDVERVEHLGLGDAVGAALDHQDRVLGAGDDQVHLEVLVLLLGRVDDEVAVELADADRADVLATGTGEIARAAEAPFIARMS